MSDCNKCVNYDSKHEHCSLSGDDAEYCEINDWQFWQPNDDAIKLFKADLTSEREARERAETELNRLRDALHETCGGCEHNGWQQRADRLEAENEALRKRVKELEDLNG